MSVQNHIEIIVGANCIKIKINQILDYAQQIKTLIDNSSEDEEEIENALAPYANLLNSICNGEELSIGNGLSLDSCVGVMEGILGI